MYMETTKNAPTESDIRKALETFNVSDGNLLKAVLHFATPINTVVGVDIYFQDGAWWYADIAFPVGMGIEDAIKRAVRAVEVSAPEGAHFINSAGGSFVKVLHSGANKVAFGAEIVCGVRIVASPELDDTFIAQAAAVAAAHSEELDFAPLSFHHAEKGFYVLAALEAGSPTEKTYMLQAGDVWVASGTVY